MRSVRALILIAASLAATNHRVEAFALTGWETDGFVGPVLVEESLEVAERWSAESAELIRGSLDGGIHVIVSDRLALELGVTDPVLERRLKNAVIEAFRVWENDSLVFDIEFKSTYRTAEMYVRPISQGEHNCPSPGGCALPISTWSNTRTLTDGRVVPGPVIYRAEVYVVKDFLIGMLAPETFDQFIGWFRQILMHEIGHTIGMGHPNDTRQPCFDTDDDPLNDMAIDPFDPYAGMQLTENFNCGAVMMGITGRCGFDFDGEAELTFDDAAGRDVLYPDTGWFVVPEPAGFLQHWIALSTVAALATARRRKAGQPQPSSSS